MSGDTERVEIITRREHRVTETATLTLCEFADEIHLEDLRTFVQLTALLPGDAQVLTREDGIEITYVTTDLDKPTVDDEPKPDAPLVHIENWHVRTDEQSTARAVARKLADAPAASRVESSTTNGDSTPVEEVRRVVELIKQATDMTTGAIADMVDIPRTSLVSIMAPSYKSRTTRRSTLDKLQNVLDELATEESAPTVDGPEDYATDRSRDERIEAQG